MSSRCHAGREAEIVRAGYRIEQRESFLFRPLPLVLPTAPHILGVARNPS